MRLLCYYCMDFNAAKMNRSFVKQRSNDVCNVIVDYTVSGILTGK